MILDNSRIHHAKKIQPFLKEYKDRIRFVFLPPYSPQLNLIERLWKWLKETVINNVFFPSTPKIKLAVRQFMNHQNQNKSAIIDRLCVQL